MAAGEKRKTDDTVHTHLTTSPPSDCLALSCIVLHRSALSCIVVHRSVSYFVVCVLELGFLVRKLTHTVSAPSSTIDLSLHALVSFYFEF